MNETKHNRTRGIEDKNNNISKNEHLLTKMCLFYYYTVISIRRKLQLHEKRKR